jgi:UDP-N-acetyl-D-mannosaminuronate dehydrogenase
VDPVSGVVNSQQIAVLGLGYVGCVTAACLSHIGHRVVGVDVVVIVAQVAPAATAVARVGVRAVAIALVARRDGVNLEA